MSYAIVTAKIDPKTKKEAQKTAAALGMPLSTLIKGFLNQLIRTKTVTFSVQDEIPNAYLRKIIKKAEENYKKGNISPAFKTAEENLKYLDEQGI